MGNSAAIATERVQLIERLNEVIRRFQQTSGFGLRAYGRGVTVALTTHALAVVCGEPGCSVKRVIQALSVPQPTLSRAIRQLHKGGLLTLKRPASDNRFWQLYPTPEGYRRHAASNASISKVYDELLASLTRSETEELYDLQKKFATGLGALDCDDTKDVHPMQRNVFRITRGLNLLRTDSFRRFGLSILGWHLLRQIAQEPAQLSAKDFVSRFEAPMNTVASVLSALHKAGLVKKRFDDNDKRITRLIPTDMGRQLLTKVARTQSAELSTATRSLTTQELERLVSLSERYLGSTSKRLVESELLPQLSVSLIDDVPNRRRVHALLKKNFCKGLSLNTDTEWVVGVFANGRLVGGAVYASNTESPVALAAHLPAQIATEQMFALLHKVATALMRR